jgi:23S rRNA pseudouridine1911/1915/1917 synthase
MQGQLLRFQFEGAAEQRLDHFLTHSIPEQSRARLQSLIKAGLVLVDGKPAKKSGMLIGNGALVEVEIPPTTPSALLAEQIPLSIIFEDGDVLVVDKPPGMVVHPAAGHSAGTLANAAIGHDPAMDGIGGEARPGIVHRLDKDTSGVIILAKNDATLLHLQDQFRRRLAEKTYLALVDGQPPTPAGRIEAAIGRDPSHRKRMAILKLEKGRAAVSQYATRETYSKHALLEFHPLTGRTHQVRLHCAFLGCPIVGDTVYGRKIPSLPVPRYFLHALELSIMLRGEHEPRHFRAPLPADLVQVLDALRMSEHRAEKGT